MSSNHLTGKNGGKPPKLCFTDTKQPENSGKWVGECPHAPKTSSWETSTIIVLCCTALNTIVIKLHYVLRHNIVKP